MHTESPTPNFQTRRAFVRAGGALIAAGMVGAHTFVRADEKPSASTPLPKRVLGKTGAEVTILGLGTAPMGHRNSNNPDLPPLVEVFSEAIDRGINYIDTARIYGRSEEALAQVLASRRDKIFLVTKVWAETAAEAEEKLTLSLSTLKLKSVDLVHLHSTGDKNIDKVLAKGGAWEFLRSARKSGLTRFLGLSGHSRPANFVRMIEEAGDVDALLIAMNFVDRHVYGFEEKVLPVARKHKIGVMAMKIFGGIRGSFPNYGAKTPHPAQMDREFHEQSIRYALSLEGVTGMVIGVHDAKQVRENIDAVAKATPLPAAELAALVEKGKSLAPQWGPRFGPVA